MTADDLTRKTKVHLHDLLVAEKKENEELRKRNRDLQQQNWELAKLNALLQRRVMAQVRHNGVMQ